MKANKCIDRGPLLMQPGDLLAAVFGYCGVGDAPEFDVNGMPDEAAADEVCKRGGAFEAAVRAKYGVGTLDSRLRHLLGRGLGL